MWSQGAATPQARLTEASRTTHGLQMKSATKDKVRYGAMVGSNDDTESGAEQSKTAQERCAGTESLSFTMSTTRPRKSRGRAHDESEMRPLADAVDEDDDDDGYGKKSKMDQWLQYILQKLHALLWIIVASALTVYTQVFEVVVNGHPPARPEAQLNRCARAVLAHAPLLPFTLTRWSCAGVHSFWFNVGLAGFGGWLVMAAYLILWVKYIKKFGGEWEEYWPQAIPIATVLAVSSLLAFVVGAWPVWGFLTIPGVFVIFLGVLNLAHFVPV